MTDPGQKPVLHFDNVDEAKKIQCENKSIIAQRIS